MLTRPPADAGTPLAVEHVFSCEIEPFKQGYIERNFAPRCSSANPSSAARRRTPHGGEQPVPGAVDLLVAGTSCVDTRT